MLALKAIADSDAANLHLYGHHFIESNPRNDVMVLICLHHYQRLHPMPGEDSDLIDAVDWLDMFYEYALSVRMLVLDPNACQKLHVQRLFGFRPVSSGTYHLLHGGIASRLASKNVTTNPRSSTKPRIIPGFQLSSFLRHYLEEMLTKCIDAVIHRYSTMSDKAIAAEPSDKHQRTILAAILRLVLIQDMLRGFVLEARRASGKR